MKKKRQAISKSRKRQILEESFKEGAVCSEIARKYGIRPAKLYNWRSNYRRQHDLTKLENVKRSNSEVASEEFVEVHLQNIEESSGSKLQEVSFKFTDYVVQISGRVDDKIIGSILKMSGVS